MPAVGRVGYGLSDAENAEVPTCICATGAVHGYHYSLLGRVEEAAQQATWMSTHAGHLPYTGQLCALVASMQGRTSDALTILATVDTASLDGHHTFHLSESYAMAGDTVRALELLERAVDMGFYPHEYITKLCPFYAALRNAPGFDRVARKAALRVAQFDAAVV